MSLYSLKMRASKNTDGQSEHISGAEKILQEKELSANMEALLMRALHHAKGEADFVNMKIEALQPDELEYIEALPVSTIPVETAAEGRQIILNYLKKLGLENGKEIMLKFRETYPMRGAMLLDATSLERLEPDTNRGLRATYMDAEHAAGSNPSNCKNHFQEALVLASKVVHAPHILAEICISDDPDYVTGYIAAKDIGYVRITKLKEPGSGDGGRIFLYRGPKDRISACIHYLEQQHVLVQHVPTSIKMQTNVPDSWSIIREQLAVKKREHLYRKMTELSSAQADHVICQGRDHLLLASNNYLGLIEHPKVKQAAKAAIDRYGCGSGGSRLTTGTLPLHRRLEMKLADFHQTEAALLFNTGYMANVGILSALGQKGMIIFSDELNHASIIDGCRLSRAKTVIYRHNDMEDLQKKIAACAPCQGMIVSDAVFSMEGDIANLPVILEISRKYHLLTMVDEAHSLGVIGQSGHGICEYFRLQEKPDILMGTLSKSLASEGGYACGSQLLIEYLQNAARSFIFSTSQSPAVLASAEMALEILRESPELVGRLQKNRQVFCEALSSAGIAASSRTAIIPVVIGDEQTAVEIGKKLASNGILVSAIRYPTVPKGTARLRIAISAAHKPDELIRAAKTMAKIIKQRQR